MIKWLAVCFVLIGCFITPAQAQVVVLDGGTLIDGTGRNPITNAVVVIEGNRIKAAGAKGQVSYPQNARVIKTDGKFILPGLIDAHIEAGKLADIAVVDANPLNDITATRKIGMVIKDGKVLDTTYDPAFRNPIPRPTR